MVKRNRWYVGLAKDGSRVAFVYKGVPTVESHGSLYRLVIGHYQDRRHAECAARHGSHYVGLSTQYPLCVSCAPPAAQSVATTGCKRWGCHINPRTSRCNRCGAAY